MNRLCDKRKFCWQEWVLVVMSTIMITMCLTGVRLVYVMGSSMTPTLSANSFHLTTLVFHPQVGDIVVFKLPTDGRTYYINRIHKDIDYYICVGACKAIGMAVQGTVDKYTSKLDINEEDKDYD